MLVLLRGDAGCVPKPHGSITRFDAESRSLRVIKELHGEAPLFVA
jgi:hypothetical protein